MKKTLLLILALMMLVSLLSACGKQEVSETGAPVSDEEAVVKTDGEDNNEDENADEKDVVQADLEYVRGVTSGDKYTSEFAELTFTLPKGWIFATDEELENMMGAGSEVVFGDDQQAMIDYAMSGTIYDMMAQNGTDGSNVIVMIENTAMYPGGTTMTEEEYLKALSSNLAMVDTVAYKVADTTGKTTIGDYEYATLEASIESYGYQTYFVRRIGKYMLCLCFTGTSANPGTAVQGYFE